MIFKRNGMKYLMNKEDMKENMRPLISIESKTKFADDDFDIQIYNLQKNQLYQIILSTQNFYCMTAKMSTSTNSLWKSTAYFKSDKNGYISINHFPSVKGDYIGIWPMGLFYNMKIQKKKRIHLTMRAEDVPYNKEVLLNIKIYTEQGKLLASKDFIRYYQSPNVISEEIYFKKSYGRLYYNRDCSNAPAIIVLSGSDGRIEKAQNIAQLLSNKGYVTLALAYFGLNKIPKYLSKIPIENIEECISFLQSLEFVNENKIGIFGRSKGAEYALVSASIVSGIKCVVVNSPIHACVEGIRGFLPSRESSWCYMDNELPYTEFSWINMFKNFCFRKQTEKFSEKSVILVEKIKAPILISGSIKDEVWNSEQAIKKINNRLRMNSFKYPYSYKLYSSIGHMMPCAYQPNNRYPSQKNIMDEAVDFWENMLMFFKVNLKDAE